MSLYESDSFGGLEEEMATMRYSVINVEINFVSWKLILFMIDLDNFVFCLKWLLSPHWPLLERKCHFFESSLLITWCSVPHKDLSSSFPGHQSTDLIPSQNHYFSRSQMHFMNYKVWNKSEDTLPLWSHHHRKFIWNQEKLTLGFQIMMECLQNVSSLLMFAGTYS